MSEAAEKPNEVKRPEPVVGIAIVFMDNGSLSIVSLEGVEKQASQDDVVALCNMVLINHQAQQMAASIQQGARGRVIVPGNGGPLNRVKALFGKGCG